MRMRVRVPVRVPHVEAHVEAACHHSGLLLLLFLRHHHDLAVQQFELIRHFEVVGHVGVQNGADDDFADFLIL